MISVSSNLSEIPWNFNDCVRGYMCKSLGPFVLFSPQRQHIQHNINSLVFYYDVACLSVKFSPSLKLFLLCNLLCYPFYDKVFKVSCLVSHPALLKLSATSFTESTGSIYHITIGFHLHTFPSNLILHLFLYIFFYIIVYTGIYEKGVHSYTGY